MMNRFEWLKDKSFIQLKAVSVKHNILRVRTLLADCQCYSSQQKAYIGKQKVVNFVFLKGGLEDRQFLWSQLGETSTLSLSVVLVGTALVT